MQIPTARVRLLLLLVAIALAFPITYRAGYKAGLRDKGPKIRALAVVRAGKGKPGSGGTSYTWYDLSKPQDALRFRIQEAHLKSIKANYYVAKSRREHSIAAEIVPSRVNAHR
jgi:hypothetical protein